MMILFRSSQRGFTLLEVAVITAVSTVIFGLVLNVLIQTNREATEASLTQGMRQEALLASQRLERLLRFRLSPAALIDSPAPGPGLPPGDYRLPREPERFLPDEITFVATEEDTTAGQPPQSLRSIAVSIKNSGGIGDAPRLAYFQTRSLSGNSDVMTKDLGTQSDRYQTSVTFRYAVSADRNGAVWTASSNQVPEILEYTIRVWPNRPAMRNFHDARDPQTGRLMGFELISAVRLP
jgi:hypothetical protein